MKDTVPPVSFNNLNLSLVTLHTHHEPNVLALGALLLPLSSTCSQGEDMKRHKWKLKGQSATVLTYSQPVGGNSGSDMRTELTFSDLQFVKRKTKHKFDTDAKQTCIFKVFFYDLIQRGQETRRVSGITKRDHRFGLNLCQQLKG